MYNGISLDIRFPPCLYRKLLSPAVVPYSNPHAHVGVASMTMDDFKQVYPVGYLLIPIIAQDRFYSLTYS